MKRIEMKQIEIDVFKGRQKDTLRVFKVVKLS